MDVVKEDSRFLWCLCHGESEPSLCINKADFNGRPKGYYYCHGCGKWGNVSPEWVDMVSKRKTICRKKNPIDWVSLNKLYQLTDLTERRSERLAKEWNVNCLPQYGIGWTGSAYSFPMRNEDGDIVGIMRRFPNGEKICVPGSHLGLFIPDSLNTQVVITEGLSDAAVATECGFFGLGKPSASFGELLITKFVTTNKIDRVVIVPDPDEAGKKSAEKVKKALTSLCECVTIKTEMDLRSYYKEFGRENAIKLLEGT